MGLEGIHPQPLKFIVGFAQYDRPTLPWLFSHADEGDESHEGKATERSACLIQHADTVATISRCAALGETAAALL